MKDRKANVAFSARGPYISRMSARSDLPDWLAHTLETAPRSPGCYLMVDRLGETVYIGKAQDLRARLSQYFQPSTSDTRFFVGLLDKVLSRIDVIVTASVKDALLLENELIKRHQPRFNVKLKDDKNFLSIRITAMGDEHPWPRLQIVRRRKKDSADYFGPFHSATAIRQTLKVISRHFQLRTCRDSDFAARTRPCLQHQIGRCPAPCVLPVDRAAYSAELESVKLFLGGRGATLVARLKTAMQAASDDLAFELAARYRDQIAAIERSLAPQQVVTDDGLDVDALGLHREGESGVIAVLQLRQGVVIGAHPYPFRRSQLPDAELLDGFLTHYFDGTRPIPDLVLTPVAVPDADAWSGLLSESRGRKVTVREPLRGDKRRLVDLAAENARASFAARQKADGESAATVTALMAALDLPRRPERIECYDISNIQGTDQVASQVVATSGALNPSQYRTFRIQREATPDDFASMREVLTRRARRILKGEPAPDLIVVDGGKGQLAEAVAVLAELGLDIPLAGLAKSRVLDEDGYVKKARRGPSRPTGPSSDDVERSAERVFRPGREDPIVLPQNAAALFLLVQLRDEAHRVAITYHRKLRKKRTLTSALDTIPGVGPTRRKALLSHFGSVARLREATPEAIAAVPGVGLALAEKIAAGLRAPAKD